MTTLPDFRVVRLPKEYPAGTEPQDAPPATFSDRAALLAAHPLKQRDYVIPTPAIRNALAQACQLIDSRGCGGAFVAHPRFGKSTAIKYILSVIDGCVPGRAYLRVTAVSRKASSPAYAYTDVLTARKSPLALAGNEDLKFERASLSLWMLVNECDANQLVLLIDEAQRYRSAELDGLLNLTNALVDRWGIRTTTLLWGQPSLRGLHATLKQTGRGDLTGRFMPWVLPYCGVRGPGELAQILALLDDASEFPDGSGLSYVAAHYPKAVANKLRFANHAEGLWKAFVNAADSNLRDQLDIGMEWISQAIESLITGNAEDDHAGWKPTADAMARAVQASGVAEALRHTYYREQSYGTAEAMGD